MVVVLDDNPEPQVYSNVTVDSKFTDIVSDQVPSSKVVKRPSTLPFDVIDFGF